MSLPIPISINYACTEATTSHLRRLYNNSYVNALAGYISDNITFGRFNIALGLRYDYQTPGTKPYRHYGHRPFQPRDVQHCSRTGRSTSLTARMPGLEVPGLKGTDVDGNKYSWKVLSPRINIAYDVTGDGKTIVKLSYATFGNLHEHRRRRSATNRVEPAAG